MGSADYDPLTSVQVETWCLLDELDLGRMRVGV